MKNFLDIKINGNVFSIRLNNTNNNTNDDREYIASISSSNMFEIYDINPNRNRNYNKTLDVLFKRKNYYKNISTFIELDNNYYFGFVGKDDSDSFLLYLYKLSFSSIDIDNVSPLITSKSIQSLYSKIVSCYKTELKYIICFYLINTNKKYKIMAFEHQKLDIKGSFIFAQENKEENYFFKCVHYFEEVGAFAIFNPEKRSFTFSFILHKNNNFVNYYSQRENITLNLENLKSDIDNNDLIKLNDKKICFISSNATSGYVNLVIINDYLDGKIKIRYYKINLNLYLLTILNKISLTLYNNFICLALSYSQIKSYDREETSSLIIFSYPNSIDFDVDITDNLKHNQSTSIDLNSKCKIDNNIFGLIPKGIKIINFTEVFELFSSKDNRRLNIGDYIDIDENVILMLSNNTNINIPKLGKIVYSMVITEPDYAIYNKYIIESEWDCFGEDDENQGHFIKNNYE